MVKPNKNALGWRVLSFNASLYAYTYPYTTHFEVVTIVRCEAVHSVLTSVKVAF